jgi:hypothetical protein
MKHFHLKKQFFFSFILLISFNARAQVYQFGNNIVNGSVITACNGFFRDSGGNGQPYAANEDYTVTFQSVSADPFRIDFLSFELETEANCTADKMLIYDGPNTAAPLLGTFCGTNSPRSITATSQFLTIRFISNGLGQFAGWNASLSCSDCATADCDDFVNLIFQNPVVLADPAGLIGDQWRFPTVLTGYDAIVEVMGTANATSVANIDNPVGPPGSWSPELGFDLFPGQDSYIDWKITMVAAGTSTPTNLPLSSRMTSYDVDGNLEYNEIHGHINPNGYILNVPTELTLLNEAPYTMIKGSTIEHTSISNDPEVKVTFYYPGQNNTFNIRLGVRSATASYPNVVRQYAASFDPCVAYTTSNVFPIIPNLNGQTAVCEVPNNLYSTSGIFSSYNWTVDGGTILSGQSTGSITVDWNTTGNRSIHLQTIDGNGCSANTARSVTVNPNPVLTAANTGPYCEGGTLQFSSTPSLGTSPYTFTWAGPLAYTATGQNPTRPSVITAHSGNYMVTATDANQCTATANTSTTVSNDPVVTVTTTTPATVCAGQSVALNASYTGGAGICTIQWQSKIGAGAWTNIPGANSAIFVATNLTASTQFRAEVSCTGGGCCN